MKALRWAAIVAVLSVSVAAQTPQKPPTSAPALDPEFKDLAALMASLPTVKVKPLDSTSALFFSALPLTCIDDLQAKPGATRPYFWQPTYKTVDNYEKVRAFFGCSDWPTAVSATWT